MKNRNKIIYDEKIYTNIGLENLVLYGIYLVSKREEICTFEKLVAECFYQFPKVFAFKRYPEWPDSLKFDRPLRKLREKGMIVGIREECGVRSCNITKEIAKYLGVHYSTVSRATKKINRKDKM